MSSNHKHSVANGSVSPSHKPKKCREWMNGRAGGWNWKTVAVLLWLVVGFSGFIWFLTSFKDGKLGRKVETSLRNEDNTPVLSENSNAVSFALKMVCLEKQTFEKQCERVTETVEFNANCPSGEATSSNYLGSPLSECISKSHFLCSASSSISSAHVCCKEQDKSQMGSLLTHAMVHCESIFFRFVNICLWILFGVAIGYSIPRIHDKFWSQKLEMIQLQQLSQQPQMQQQAQCPPRSDGGWRKKVLVVLIVVGFLSSAGSFWYLTKDIKLKRKETLGSMCDERARMLQDQFNVSMNHVHALALLISTFHHGKQPSAIDQKTFEEYTESTAFERPLTSGVAYALKVRHSEREHVEQQFGWTIKKMETENQTIAQDYNPENFRTSPAQDEYAPVIFSQKTVSHIVSIDMMSGKEDRENILRARASGKGVLTSPFKLLKSNHLGVVLTFAVYRTHLPPLATPEERIDAAVGYLGASYDVPSLVEKLLHQLASKQSIIVNVYDTTDKALPIKMYGTDEAGTELLHVSYLDFGDPTRKHEMHCRFKQKPSPPWQAITASVAVVIITLLMGYIFYDAIIQIAKVELDYEGMMELKHRAEAADVAKSQFLATVSHEIRTPMNGVLGMLQMLMDTNLDASQLDYAQTAHASGNDLISLINKVLDQAKIESGRLELDAVAFDLRAGLDRILSIFSGKSHEKGIELAVYVSNHVPEVVIGDQERFGQIITNLVGNSIKFTHDKGHIFVSVHLADEVRLPDDIKDEVLRQSLNITQDSLNSSYNTLSGFQVVDRWRSWENFKNLAGTAEEPGKIKLLVTVEDTGAGIPPDAQGRIFTPFMQADSSTSRKYGGTGIGLSISERLVNLMGGEIGFVSELGVGSTFSFTVTLTKAEANSSDAIRPLPRDQVVSEFQGLRALVIDEKIIRAEVARYHLQRLGISVAITSSLESACSYFSCNCQTSVSKSEDFAMVLIDQENWVKETCLPFHNLIKRMRHNGPRNNLCIPLKVFLLSAHISSTDRDKFKLDELLDDLITKPLRLNALISTFQEATGKRHDTRVKPPSTLKSILKGRPILVVDDNAVNRRVAEGALKKYGAVVTCVNGGMSAVELLKPPHQFEACFMDLQMPEIDGFEATRQIRELERKYNERIASGEGSVGMTGNISPWHTPILAMTADVIQATNEKCMKFGMDDYVSKPFGEGQLYSTVARFFEDR